jgi:hypothetical protein
MELIITPAGNVRSVYDEAIPLNELGQIRIIRASSVEPDSDGGWFADLAPVEGPRLGPFQRRSNAILAEADWLRRYWLTSQCVFDLRDERKEVQ